MQYRVHVQNIGWMNWVDAGQVAGTTGQGLRLEGIEIRLLESLHSITVCSTALTFRTMEITRAG